MGYSVIAKNLSDWSPVSVLSKDLSNLRERDVEDAVPYSRIFIMRCISNDACSVIVF